MVQTIGRCHVPLRKMLKRSLLGEYDKGYYGIILKIKKYTYSYITI